MWHDAGHPRQRPAHGSGGGSSAVHSAAEIGTGSDAWSMSGPRREALWMQTTGAALLAAERCSLARVLILVQDGHSLHGLLYLAAVPDDSRQRDNCQDCVDINSARDLLLRRSFHAAGQPATSLIGAGSLIVWLQLDVSGFCPVLARGWHGACCLRTGDHSLVSYRHGGGCCRSPGNFASCVTRFIRWSRMSWWPFSR